MAYIHSWVCGLSPSIRVPTTTHMATLPPAAQARAGVQGTWGPHRAVCDGVPGIHGGASAKDGANGPDVHEANDLHQNVRCHAVDRRGKGRVAEAEHAMPSTQSRGRTPSGTHPTHCAHKCPSSRCAKCTLGTPCEDRVCRGCITQDPTAPPHLVSRQSVLVHDGHVDHLAQLHIVLHLEHRHNAVQESGGGGLGEVLGLRRERNVTRADRGEPPSMQRSC
jgi:hypothetical protein